VVAADQGLAAAQSNLGLFYAHGTATVVKDVAAAIRWYRKAAD
jgi:TPR repeat protein